MKDKLRNFMIGRYGVDQFSRFLLGLTLTVMIISMFAGRGILYIIAVLFLVFSYYRMFSKNCSQRYLENNWYLNKKNRLLNVFRKTTNTVRQKRLYHIYKCPNCRQKIRIPRGKGKISIICPKCHNEFVKKS
jgi:hypothetical protein